MSKSGEWIDNNFLHPEQLTIEPDNIQNYIDLIFDWGIKRNLTAEGGATALAQVTKLIEEVGEIKEGIEENNRDKVVDGIGDSLVVLVQLARLAGVSFDEALAKAWNDIKDRKGEMKCGIFVKETDLKLLEQFECKHLYDVAKDASQVKAALDEAKARAGEIK